jgi:hypothetical protein
MTRESYGCAAGLLVSGGPRELSAVVVKAILQAPLAIFLVTGCVHTSEITGQDEIVGWEDELRRIAGFDFSCEPAKLQLTPLGGGGFETVGVLGCGQKGTYRRLIGGGWVGTSRSSVVEQPEPVRAPVVRRDPDPGQRTPLQRREDPAVRGECTAARIAEMRKAGVSESAIDSACQNGPADSKAEPPKKLNPSML